MKLSPYLQDVSDELTFQVNLTGASTGLYYLDAAQRTEVTPIPQTLSFQVQESIHGFAERKKGDGKSAAVTGILTATVLCRIAYE